MPRVRNGAAPWRAPHCLSERQGAEGAAEILPRGWLVDCPGFRKRVRATKGACLPLRTWALGDMTARNDAVRIPGAGPLLHRQGRRWSEGSHSAGHVAAENDGVEVRPGPADCAKFWVHPDFGRVRRFLQGLEDSAETDEPACVDFALYAVLESEPKSVSTEVPDFDDVSRQGCPCGLGKLASPRLPQPGQAPRR